MPDPIISPQTMSGSWDYSDPTSTWTGSGADAGKTLTATRSGSAPAGTPASYFSAGRAFDTQLGNAPGQIFQTGTATTVDLLLDFGNRNVELTSLQIYEPSPNGYFASDFIVYESSDNTNWNQIGSGNIPFTTGWHSYNIAGASYKRYLKFTLTKTGGVGYNGLCELELYGLTTSGGGGGLFFKGFP